jgi:endogenous inhibitor of DNA gyrase (YacG/DUF329 family)
VTCRLIDLGRWLDERYLVVSESSGDTGAAPIAPDAGSDDVR